MVKPTTLVEFVTLLSSMSHRERLVFKANDSHAIFGEDDVTIEIYKTQLFASRFGDFNYKISPKCYGGATPVRGGKSRSIIERYFMSDREFQETVYGLIK